MRLTNSDRDAFVRAVMDDVPKTDYSEQAMKLCEEAFLKAADPRLLAVYNDPKLRDRLEGRYVALPGYLQNFYHRLVDDKTLTALRSQLEELANKHREQVESRSKLETQLRGAIYGCTTLKQAKEVLPEFEKYLPQERDGKVIRSMPVVANLVTDLMNAGWPKDKK